jgi:hypothetical protein
VKAKHAQFGLPSRPVAKRRLTCEVLGQAKAGLSSCLPIAWPLIDAHKAVTLAQVRQVSSDVFDLVQGYLCYRFKPQKLLEPAVQSFTRLIAIFIRAEPTLIGSDSTFNLGVIATQWPSGRGY